MPIQRILQLGGLNIYLNPFLKNDGDLIRAVNVESIPYGAKSRRPGYTTFLGTADGQKVNDLWSWNNNLYRASGSSIFYSLGGTGAWTLAGNGTISNNYHVGRGILGTVMIVGDGVTNTRHTTNGTSFIDTTLAPKASQFVDYQQRMYAMGTASTLFYSTTGDASNWNTSGTSDSSSIDIPGEGILKTIFKASDRILTGKTSGLMHRWDGYSLVDMATTSGPTSPYSVAEKEGYNVYLNRDGIQIYNGVDPKTISNAVQGEIYNNFDTGVIGTSFNGAPGVVHDQNYFLSLGTVTDDYTRETVPDCVLKYHFQHNEFLNYKYANFPTAWLSYVDANGDKQHIFGGANGQCYKITGSVLSDNGTPIASIQEYMIHLGTPELDKKWIWFTGFFNPGCEANIQIAVSDAFDKDSLKWINLGDAKKGSVQHRFPRETRGKFLFIKITDSSTTAKLTCYGFAVEADPIPIS